MDIFTIVAGSASIISLVLSVITLTKVTNIEKTTNTVKAKEIKDTTFNQARTINNR